MVVDLLAMDDPPGPYFPVGLRIEAHRARVGRGEVQDQAHPHQIVDVSQLVDVLRFHAERAKRAIGLDTSHVAQVEIKSDRHIFIEYFTEAQVKCEDRVMGRSIAIEIGGVTAARSFT